MKNKEKSWKGYGGEDYWWDGSYVEDTSFGFMSADDTGKKLHWDLGDHSAIIHNATNQTVYSKWGKGPLMSHAYYYSPYYEGPPGDWQLMIYELD